MCTISHVCIPHLFSALKYCLQYHSTAPTDVPLLEFVFMLLDLSHSSESDSKCKKRIFFIISCMKNWGGHHIIMNKLNTFCVDMILKIEDCEWGVILCTEFSCV